MRNLRIISSHLSRSLRSIQSNPIQPHRHFSSTQPENVSRIVTELSNLTLLETMDLTELLKKKLGVSETPILASMSLPGSGAGAAAAGAGKGEGEKKKAEAKTAFDVMLKGFEAASKIKVIKEVRSVTDLGLKEAKDLVEKAPTLLKKGVSKEEAEKIVEKLKAVGAKVDLE
ncbi:unnamed protein product [Eruca vesicaria subsp. sativa]|uniref:Ribosomal protein L12 n=1 Tax=Eruca vesicaria subsp. sativa TaxID=29727 RepID=A0ABC8LPB7_ERUVS|nr:unnamed protein product [Eruca vesicaria subsp. sativa]